MLTIFWISAPLRLPNVPSKVKTCLFQQFLSEAFPKKVPSASVLRIRWPSNKFSKLSRGPKLHKEIILKSPRHHNHFLLWKTRAIGHFFTFLKKFLQFGPTDRKKCFLLNRRSSLPMREKKMRVLHNVNYASRWLYKAVGIVETKRNVTRRTNTFLKSKT